MIAMNEPGRGRSTREAYGEWRRSRLGAITDALEGKLLLELLGGIEGARILDVGCGDGTFAGDMLREGAHVTAMDADPDMIVAAHRRAAHFPGGEDFLVADADRLPFADGAFDAVTAVTVLCLLGNPSGAVREMARVLKPGGRLVIGELGRWSIWAAWRRFKGWFGIAPWKRVRFHDSAMLSSWASDAGLEVKEIRGAIHYPPFAFAARAMAPLDAWLGRHVPFGAAFLVLRAIKPAPRQ